MKTKVELNKAQSYMVGGAMKNRPFSSENKYGNMRRYNPNLNLNMS